MSRDDLSPKEMDEADERVRRNDEIVMATGRQTDPESIRERIHQIGGKGARLGVLHPVAGLDPREVVTFVRVAKGPHPADGLIIHGETVEYPEQLWLVQMVGGNPVVTKRA